MVPARAIPELPSHIIRRGVVAVLAMGRVSAMYSSLHLVAGDLISLAANQQLPAGAIRPLNAPLRYGNIPHCFACPPTLCLSLMSCVMQRSKAASVHALCFISWSSCLRTRGRIMTNHSPDLASVSHASARTGPVFHLSCMAVTGCQDVWA